MDVGAENPRMRALLDDSPCMVGEECVWGRLRLGGPNGPDRYAAIGGGDGEEGWVEGGPLECAEGGRLVPVGGL